MPAGANTSAWTATMSPGLTVSLPEATSAAPRGEPAENAPTAVEVSRRDWVPWVGHEFPSADGNANENVDVPTVQFATGAHDSVPPSKPQWSFPSAYSISLPRACSAHSRANLSMPISPKWPLSASDTWTRGMNAYWTEM